MDTADYLDSLRANSALAVAAARRAGVDAPVPTCPDWSVADLALHLGRVYRWMSAVVETRADEFVHFKVAGEPGEGEGPVEWLEAAAGRALTVLGGTDPDTPVWNWADGAPAPARFWFRRMAHESAIHRADAEAAAEAAAGRDPAVPTPIEPAEMASDGIDELVHLLPVRARAGRLAKLTGSYHFHTTDVPGEWVVDFGGGGEPAVRREHAKADVAVRGPASALLLFLYNRRGSDGLEVFGDPEKVAAWTDQIRF